ncbi:AMP-binding protein [Alicyclobacillus vulcanalis]|uniref:Acyl-CoA synthetase (AMP-forming)/AMP-acid ligase II n=1 Tax=Alicyclobacillus vulcanalis TaxID=252246 RepID=A0A1N7N2R3_9BACL|nr:AMP-binding protein [Alicyclobacillus vulcanalis]SIS92703.1 Acyl-CoA synthetase (AMP-forming)/AMP-acid ligase II [Alicyclobacillus vulcanalis]
MSNLTNALALALDDSSRSVVWDGRWYTAGDLRKHITTLRAELASAGVRAGQRVMGAVPNSYAFVVSYLACLEHGAIFVPANSEMPAGELERALARYQAHCAILAPEAAGRWSDSLQAHGFSRTRSVDMDAAGGQAVQLWQTSDAAPYHVAADAPDERPAVLMFTSGTTGEPKGVLLRHGHLWAAVQNVIESHRLTPSDVAYCILPLFHINGQVIVLLSTLVSGGRIVMRDKFHASLFWDDIRDHGVTWVSCVPTILSIVAKRPAPKEALGTLRFLRSASAPLTPAVAARIEAAFGVPVIEAYGMTEAAGQICTNPIPPGVRKPGSVGKPVGVALVIVDEHRQPLPPYELGEIAIRGAGVIDHYEGREPEPDYGYGPGWIYTGDLGYMDEDGYVYITGRAKEMINRAGEKLSPREIEDVLNAHEAVARSAVVGLPDPLYGERVVAWVVPEEPEGIDADALRAELASFCAEHLAKPKWPAQIVIARSLPVNATGKVQKHVLRNLEPRDRLA